MRNRGAPSRCRLPGCIRAFRLMLPVRVVVSRAGGCCSPARFGPVVWTRSRRGRWRRSASRWPGTTRPRSSPIWRSRSGWAGTAWPTSRYCAASRACSARSPQIRRCPARSTSWPRRPGELRRHCHGRPCTRNVLHRPTPFTDRGDPPTQQCPADQYTAVAETTDHGCPIRDHLAALARRRDHLGAGSGRCPAGVDPERRLRAAPRPGPVDRVPVPRRRAGRALGPVDLAGVGLRRFVG